MTKEAEELLPILHPDNKKEESPENNQQNQPSHSLTFIIVGICAAFGKVISHVMSAVCIQLLKHEIPDLELSALRGFTGFLICSLILFFKKSSPKVPCEEIQGTIFYSVAAAITKTLFYISFALAPASGVNCCVTAVNMTSGLILFWLCWKEKILVQNLLLTLLCMIGVLLILQPWYNMQEPAPKYNENFTCGLSNMSVGIHENCGTLQNFWKLARKDSLPVRLMLVCCKNNCTIFHHDEITVNDMSFDLHTVLDRSQCKEKETMCFLPDIFKICHNNKTLISEKSINIQEICEQDNFTSWTFSGHRFSNKTTGRSDAFFKIFLPEKTVWFIGYGMGMLAGLGISLSTLAWKYYPHVAENAVRSVIFLLMTQTLLSAILMAIIETPVFLSNFYDITLVIIHCLTSVSSYAGFVFAMKHLPAQTYFILLSTETVLFLLAQYTILSSILPGYRNWIEVLGVCLVLLGSSLCSLAQLLEKRKKPEE